ncbi:PA14 domain-containing protein [Streptomyces sp. GC420]|uniref:PA14 domain-containing protein n=1 Tax=Streptomyces sp. GC420 TaxID=2697568 RepID=UPI001414FDE4|nr:PA14 domain-containing protein [Streptomyces sp. GC420]NBM19713.1 hypothetical protein [Streptomyces sp. GC420]
MKDPHRRRAGRVRRATAPTLVLAAAGGLLTATTAAGPAAAAVNCASPTWKAQFYANTTFGGTPKLTACDKKISEDYGTGDPAGVTLPKNNFSVRWSVTRDFGSGGPFRLSAAAQDGIRVYVDGVRKIDLWSDVSSTRKKTADVTIPSGKHTLRVDFAAWTGSADVSFGYAPRTSADVDRVKPLAPSGASATYDTGTRKATVRWSANKEMDLAGYRVYRRLDGSGSWTRVSGSTPLTATSYADTPPATGEKYYYEVRAVDKAGNASPGSTDKPVTTPDRTAPATPTGLEAHADLYGLYVSWNPVPDAAGYQLHELDPATGEYTLAKDLTGTTYRYVVTPPEALHSYRVLAYDAAGNRSPLSTAVVSDGIDRTPPPAPQKLHTALDPGTVDLYWQIPASLDGELSNGAFFTVYRSEGGTVGADAPKVKCAEYSRTGGSGDTLDFHCSDTQWALDTEYTYGVTLTDGKGNESGLSNTVTVTTPDRTAPLPLVGLRATPRADGMLLSWDAPTDDDISGYHGLMGMRRADGTVRWLDSCLDSSDNPHAMLCIDVPDGQTLVYTVVARDVWRNALSPTDPTVPTVTATELSLVPPESVGSDTGPLYGGGGWTGVEDATKLHWRCAGEVCGTVTEYRVSRWNPLTGTYEPLHTEPAVAGTTYYSHLDETQPLGETSFYRVVGILADGTETAAAHPWRIRPDLA